MTEAPANTITLTTASVDETRAVGRALGAVLERGDVVALIGPLGAGKTQLVRGLAAGLGADPRQVASPTYVLMQEYAGRIPLVHIDAYRLEGLSDVESIGWSSELLDDSVTVIEWADRMADEVPADGLHVRLDHVDEAHRRITFQAPDAWRDRLYGLMHDLSDSQTPLTESANSGSTKAPAHTPCPICRAAVPGDAPDYPFCSQRCRLADLNRWFKGEYRLSRPTEPDDDLEDLMDGPT